jgi:hypothetical protein
MENKNYTEFADAVADLGVEYDRPRDQFRMRTPNPLKLKFSHVFLNISTESRTKGSVLPWGTRDLNNRSLLF